MIKDISPNVGDILENGATVIAKNLHATLSDQNEYIVLCIYMHPGDSIMPYEYVTWHLMANEEQYMTEWGHYHFTDFKNASEEYIRRANLIPHEN